MSEGRDAISVREEKTPKDRRILIYEPGKSQPPAATALVFIHGGGWAAGNPELFDRHCRYFASKGFLAVSVEYRLTSPRGVTVFESIADVKSAIRWVRQHAAELGVSPKRIVAIGDSAGGHLAACAGVVEGLEGAGEDLTVSSRPDAMVLIYPILDTTAPDGWDLVKFSGQAGSLVVGRAEEFSPVDHVKPGIPPTLVLHGTADDLTPMGWSERFVQRMKEEGNDARLVRFENQKHAFISVGYGDDATIQKALEIVLEFLNSSGFGTEVPDPSP